jgi:hypothetical protein
MSSVPLFIILSPQSLKDEMKHTQKLVIFIGSVCCFFFFHFLLSKKAASGEGKKKAVLKS